LNKTPIWDIRLVFYYCQTVASLLMWGALSDERTGLSFISAAGPSQGSHSGLQVPRVSLPYFIFSILDSFFRRLLRLAGLRRRYSTPPPHGINVIISLLGPTNTQLLIVVQIVTFSTISADCAENTILFCCLRAVA
jgi:hypothetical protein